MLEHSDSRRHPASQNVRLCSWCKGRISKRLAKVKCRPDKETKKEEVCLRKQARENTGAERVSKNNVP